MSYLRSKVVAQAQSWIGCKESDGSHKKIIDVYNSHKPLARSYAVKYTDAWCATFVSACAIAVGYTDIMPTECGCQEMIKLYQKLGCWKEDDSYVPSAGDVIFYDWQDSGTGDNTGGADHVGLVEKVASGKITVIEGNCSDQVMRRTIAVNGKYIRGFGLPAYSDAAVSTSTTSTEETKTTSSSTSTTKEVKASKSAAYYSKSIAGTYKCTTQLNMRDGAGTGNKILVTMAKGQQVKNYGYYSSSSGTRWYYIQFTKGGVKYTGFASSKYLVKC